MFSKRALLIGGLFLASEATFALGGCPVGGLPRCSEANQGINGKVVGTLVSPALTQYVNYAEGAGSYVVNYEVSGKAYEVAIECKAAKTSLEVDSKVRCCTSKGSINGEQISGSVICNPGELVQITWSDDQPTLAKGQVVIAEVATKLKPETTKVKDVGKKS